MSSRGGALCNAHGCSRKPQSVFGHSWLRSQKVLKPSPLYKIKNIMYIVIYTINHNSRVDIVMVYMWDK